MQMSETPSISPIVSSHSIRRITRIARQTGASSYLEIGVNTGRTFNGVDLQRKVAVDPEFNFDVDQYRRDGIEFYSMPSDRYFTMHAASLKFDIIFLDGLHTFQQTFRDFCNSLACAHDRTVWLIDDVLPVDVFSAWPDQKESVRFRKRAGFEGQPWHGDVYKIVFALHDFFPMYSYVTLQGKGNPQTVVWKSPREDFTPIFNNLEAVERLTYFDLLKRLDTLNLRRENDGFRVFLESWARAEKSHGKDRGKVSE